MNYDKEELYNRVKEGINECGEWYLDWGISSDIYKNCPTQSFANDVARRLKAEGCDIYIGRMGYGSSRIAEGTPICYRIFKGRYPNRHMDEWVE